MAGTRYSRDDDRFQALLHILNRLFRTNSQTGGIVNAIPILKTIAPEITGHKESLEHITNLKEFFKVSDTCRILPSLDFLPGKKYPVGHHELKLNELAT
jgi:hypothetical protein